jgi:hypothetical protein
LNPLRALRPGRADHALHALNALQPLRPRRPHRPDRTGGAGRPLAHHLEAQRRDADGHRIGRADLKTLAAIDTAGDDADLGARHRIAAAVEIGRALPGGGLHHPDAVLDRVGLVLRQHAIVLGQHDAIDRLQPEQRDGRRARRPHRRLDGDRTQRPAQPVDCAHQKTSKRKTPPRLPGRGWEKN